MSNNATRGELFAKYVGLELKGRITSQGYNAKLVAEGINRQPSAFNLWLNNKREMPISVFCEACEFIGVEPAQLVEYAYDRMVYEFESTEAQSDYGLAARAREIEPTDEQ